MSPLKIYLSRLEIRLLLRIPWKLLKITIQSCLCEIMSTVWDAEVRSPRTEVIKKNWGGAEGKLPCNP